MRNGIKPLVEVLVIRVVPFNKLLMVDISLQDLHILSEMVGVMYG